MSNENSIPTTDTDLLRVAVDLNRDQLKELKTAIPPSQNPSLFSLASHLQATPRHDEVARIFCIQALGQTGEPAVLSSLLTATNSRSKEVRKAVAIALANVHHPMSAYLLLPMLLDDSARVRKTAMRALMQLGQPSTAESILAAAMSDALCKSVFTESLQQLDPRQQRTLLDAFEVACSQVESDSIPQSLLAHISSPKAIELWENYAILTQSTNTWAMPEENADHQSEEHVSYEDPSTEATATDSEYAESDLSNSSGDDEHASDESSTDEPTAGQDSELNDFPAIVRVDDESWQSLRPRSTFSGAGRSKHRTSRSLPVSIRSKSTLSVSRRIPTQRVASSFAAADFSAESMSASSDSSSPISSLPGVDLSEASGNAEKGSEKAPEQTYAEWFQNRFLKSQSITFIAAFYVHLLLLLLLATVYLAAPETFAPFSFNAAMSDEFSVDEGSFQLSEAELDLSDIEPTSMDTELSEMTVSSQMPLFAESATVALPSMFTNPGQSAATAAAVAGNPGHQNAPIGRAPAGAVSAGSFSVWTIPDNPDPGEPYKIVIQMRVPDGTDKYSISDLEGVVVGSDGYQKLIPGGLKGFLPVIDGRVQMEVHIVSADENVEDTVFIRSRLLREAQRLQIRF